MLRTALLLPIILLPACATIVNGTGQSVTVQTAPPGASCAVDRMGRHLGDVLQTPGSLRVDKSKNDLTVTCRKPGFQTAAVTQSPTFNGITFANILAGGAVGFVVDAATGANYNYPSDIRMGLVGGPAYGRGARYAADAYRYSPRVLLDSVAAHAASY